MTQRKRKNNWASNGASSHKKEKVEETKLNWKDNSWIATMTKQEGYLRQHVAVYECIIYGRVPNHARAFIKAAYPSIWLQVPVVNLPTSYVFELNPELKYPNGKDPTMFTGNGVHNIMAVPPTTAPSTPLVNRTLYMPETPAPMPMNLLPGTENHPIDFYYVDVATMKDTVTRLEEERLRLTAQVTGMARSVTQLETDFASSRTDGNDINRVVKRVHEAKMKELDTEKALLHSNLQKCEKELEIFKDGLRKAEFENSKQAKIVLQKYMEHAAQAIGFLQSLCSDALLTQLKCDDNYVAAIANNDVVKTAYIIKSFVNDANSENISEANFKRISNLMNNAITRADQFPDYAVKVIEEYGLYRELGGTLEESNIVNAIITSVSPVFPVLCDQWRMNFEGTRPNSVRIVIDRLRTAYTRVCEEHKTQSTRNKGQGETHTRQEIALLVQNAMLKDTGLCFAFKREGKCKYGDRCKYSHGTPEPRSNHGHTGEGKKTQKVLLCSYMTESGQCSRGESCKRAAFHVLSKSIHDEQISKNKPRLKSQIVVPHRKKNDSDSDSNDRL